MPEKSSWTFPGLIYVSICLSTIRLAIAIWIREAEAESLQSEKNEDEG